MSHKDKTSVPMNDGGEPARRHRHRPAERRGGRWIVMAMIAGLTFFAGAVTAGAFGGGPFGGGHFMGHGGWHGGFMRGNPDPAMVEKRITRMMKHVAVEIDASPDQQAKLVAVATGAAKDLLPMRQSFRAARDKARHLLTSPVIDRDAIEKLRAEQIARADAASRRVSQALGDAAEILTPQQRQVIARRIQKFKSFRQRWFRG